MKRVQCEYCHAEQIPTERGNCPGCGAPLKDSNRVEFRLGCCDTSVDALTVYPVYIGGIKVR